MADKDIDNDLSREKPSVSGDSKAENLKFSGQHVFGKGKKMRAAHLAAARQQKIEAKPKSAAYAGPVPSWSHE